MEYSDYPFVIQPLVSSRPFFALFSRYLLTICPLFHFSPICHHRFKTSSSSFLLLFFCHIWLGLFFPNWAGTLCCALGLHLQPVPLLWHLFPVTLPPLPVLYNRGFVLGLVQQAGGLILCLCLGTLINPDIKWRWELYCLCLGFSWLMILNKGSGWLNSASCPLSAFMSSSLKLQNSH